MPRAGNHIRFLPLTLAGADEPTPPEPPDFGLAWLLALLTDARAGWARTRTGAAGSAMGATWGSKTGTSSAADRSRAPGSLASGTNGAATAVLPSVAADRATTVDATAIDSMARTTARTNGSRIRR